MLIIARFPCFCCAEHHYLFTAQDIGERPAWAQALQKGSPVREGELILSCGAYFSPIHLVTGDFGVQAAVDAVCKGNKVPVVAHRSALEAGYYPVYHLRRGFDAARGLPVPLRDALAGFRA